MGLPYRLLLFCILGIGLKLGAQDVLQARKVVRELCSDDFAGRGYVEEGTSKTLKFLQQEFKKYKLQPMSDGFLQPFAYQAVAYPEMVRLVADGIDLIPGEEFLADAGFPTLKGFFQLLRVDSAMLDNGIQFEKLKKQNLRNTFLIVDEVKSWNLLHPERAQVILTNEIGARGHAYVKVENLVWSVAHEFSKLPVLRIKKGVLKEPVLKLEINIEAQIMVLSSANAVGYVKGKKYPDSFLVVTAHFDHLGKFGANTIFPGANDNASGIAMMLDLAAWFSKNQPDFSVVFIAFGGEEAGLLGSLYFTENPLVPLTKIRFLLNLDLMGTGDKGLTAVNGSIFPNEFSLLQTCNSIGSYLPAINARGKAANSDHYYFSEKGVPALFVYLMGDYHHYHDPGDSYENLPFSKYTESFLLLKDFLEALQD